SESLLPGRETVHAGAGIRPGGRVFVANTDVEPAGADPPRVAQFYIVDLERHVADGMIAAIPVQIGLSQGQAQDIAVGARQQAREREHAAVVVHGMADDASPVRVALRINGVAVRAAVLRRLAREVAGRVRIFGAQPPAAQRRRTPGLEPELPDELGRQAAGFVLAYPLRVEHQRQLAPRRTQPHVVTRHLVAGLIFADGAVLGLVVVAEHHVDERAPVAGPVATAPLRGASQAELQPGTGPEIEAHGEEAHVRHGYVVRLGFTHRDTGAPRTHPRQPFRLERVG